MKREEMIEELVEHDLENMSPKEMARIIGDILEDQFESFSDEELIERMEDRGMESGK